MHALPHMRYGLWARPADGANSRYQEDQAVGRRAGVGAWLCSSHAVRSSALCGAACCKEPLHARSCAPHRLLQHRLHSRPCRRHQRFLLARVHVQLLAPCGAHTTHAAWQQDAYRPVGAWRNTAMQSIALHACMRSSIRAGRGSHRAARDQAAQGAAPPAHRGAAGCVPAQEVRRAGACPACAPSPTPPCTAGQQAGSASPQAACLPACLGQASALRTPLHCACCTCSALRISSMQLGWLAAAWEGARSCGPQLQSGCAPIPIAAFSHDPAASPYHVVLLC